MASSNSCNMWVFREGRSTASGKTSLAELQASLPAHASPSHDRLVDALLRAGELECALADADAADAPLAVSITSSVAAALVGLPGSLAGLRAATKTLERISVPDVITVSPPEGFAYYAVHPLDIADLADSAPFPESQAALIGIRSIGTTLSAVVSAALQRRGARAERITVRPVGHPYDRRTTFSPDQLRWIGARRAAAAEFLVVDEGPGISGSSFLSVGDALLAAGIARERITFLCSRYADPESLAARDGASRWRSFHSKVVESTRRTPADRGPYMGGGEWRQRFYGEESKWPSSWTQMERLKFLSRDERRIFKFHGFGRFGSTVADRARLLGEAGFGPRLVAHSCGFSELEMVEGRPMNATRVSAAVLERVADYCALRAVEFESARTQQSQLDAMVRFNVGEEFGSRMASGVPPLPTERLVIADGRMLPHEWISTPAGALIKTDGATHGDDHFFPGPVDIAWDLAGAIVEWGMTSAAAHYMLAHYRKRSGDDVSSRVEAYLLAYGVFRMAYCAMAAFSMRGSQEETRLRYATAHYRNLVEGQLKAPGFRPPASGERNPQWRQGTGKVESALALGDGGANPR
ncbi:MAG: hypothetical protein ACXVZQ_06020 [Terriglobales bacterium]